MKDKFLKFLRRQVFQKIWKNLFHNAKIGMNFWGGSSVGQSGEIPVMKYLATILQENNQNIIFDVGANMGNFTFLAKEIFKNKIIYSFEPSPFTFKILESKVLARGDSESIKVFNFGFGSTREKVKLYSSEKGSSTASIYNLQQPAAPFASEFSEDIQLRTIDDFCQEQGIKSIDFLKLDIEGHELQALLGASQLLKEKKIKFIQFEFGECHVDSRTFFRDFYQVLSPHYTFFRIVSNGIWPLGEYTTELEIFSTANYLGRLK